MQSHLVQPSSPGLETKPPLPTQSSTTLYNVAEQQLTHLIQTENLDQDLSHYQAAVDWLDTVLSTALSAAFGQATGDEAAHRFIQRVLYRINRLNLFWYDDLRNYTNERSIYLQQLRDRLEHQWQQWELAHFDLPTLQQSEIKAALGDRAAADLDPPLSSGSRYLREEMSVEGYRHLLAIASFDGLIEASRLSRILGGAANEVQATLTKVLLEEYGNGRLARKHSTFFAQMMAELNLNTRPEAYFDLVPWEVLAGINHNFLLTERKRHFLRYNGGLAYFEVAGPAAYRTYFAAAQRLGLSDQAMGYWELHIREDERHGRWMMDDVVFPLADQYPQDAWELLLGYDQEKWMGDRAAEAVVRAIQQAEQAGTIL